MPELPEVEVTRRGLLEALPGRVVVSVAWSRHRLRTATPRRLLESCIAGAQIRTIDRRAKYLLIRMTSGAVLVLHLGMTGKLGILGEQMPRHKHDHLMLLLDNSMELRFNDSRRFGAINVWPSGQAGPLEAALSAREGMEPFADECTARALMELARSRRQPIKALLMQSRLIAGIGNIYANEILFAAKINPLSPASELTLGHWQRVLTQTRRILTRAIEAGGSTIADFLGASGNPGYFQLQLKVYGRAGDPCSRCRKPVVKTTLAGRATYFCPACQPLQIP